MKNTYNSLWTDVTKLIMKYQPLKDYSEDGQKAYVKKLNAMVEPIVKDLCHKYELAKVPICECCGEEI